MSPKGQYERPNRKVSPHPGRIPVGSRDRLKFEEREGYHRRVVNDVDGRIEMFKQAGYELVTTPTAGAELQAGDASQIGSVVRKPVGGGVDGVLMEIPKEWYEEDQAAKEQRRLLKETSLLSEAPQVSEKDSIKITRPGGVTIE